MPVNVSHIKAIVLKKTKLSETDLIVTLFTEEGAQVRAVAKGARKPSSTFSSRLELFSNVDVLLAKGKNLDIVREVKLIKAYSDIRKNIEKFSAASPGIEILEKTSLQDTKIDNLYDLTLNFLDVIETTDSSIYLKALCIADLIKVCSIIGFRPSFANCSICGDDISSQLQDINIPIRFSFNEGGVLCIRCSGSDYKDKYSAACLNLCHKLLHAKFKDIVLSSINTNVVNDALLFMDKWIIYHLGIKLRSVYFYIKNTD